MESRQADFEAKESKGDAEGLSTARPNRPGRWFLMGTLTADRRDRALIAY